MVVPFLCGWGRGEGHYYVPEQRWDRLRGLRILILTSNHTLEAGASAPAVLRRKTKSNPTGVFHVLPVTRINAEITECIDILCKFENFVQLQDFVQVSKGECLNSGECCETAPRTNASAFRLLLLYRFFFRVRIRPSLFRPDG